MQDCPQPFHVGTDTQLLFDERFFAETQGVRLTVNPPWQDHIPVLVADQPWEQAIGCYNTVSREDATFRMWYDVLSEAEGRTRRFLCYAESSDGCCWHKPGLGVIPCRGDAHNNIVAPVSAQASQQGGSVFRDEHGSAEHRYKLWTKYQASDADQQEGIGTGLWAMTSPDGIRWQLLRDGYPLKTGAAADTQSICFWDEDLQRYVGFVRIKEFPAGRQRTCSVGVTTSTDFIHWTQAVQIHAADDRDENAPVPGGAPRWRPPMDYYVPGGMKIPGVPHAYVILPNAYYHWREDAFPSTMDIRLATSRNLKTWWQPTEREPFLRLGSDGSAAAGMLFANPGLIPAGDELWLYYAGVGSDHRGQQGDRSHGGIFRARLRRDGFVSADAGYAGGEFTTPLLTFAGTRLELNLDGSAGGWLQAEILTPEGQPVPGYSLSECDVIRGNAVRKPVTWKERQEVTGLAGQPVRLRFVMRSMKLYAFQFPG